MQDDTEELNPGREEFWQSFYSDDGRLMSKEWNNRRSAEISENGSLKDHYEWFMLYSTYEEPLSECVLSLLESPWPASVDSHPLRVLHVGSGNSDLCDHLQATVASLCQRPQFGLGEEASVGSILRQHDERAQILNVDICKDLVAYLAKRFPQRRYGAGNCCRIVSSAHRERVSDAGSGWYHYTHNDKTLERDETHNGALELSGVDWNAVDMVCDKGTLDALMSAFAGEFNPNVEAYANEMLAALRPGGVLFLVSINAEEVVCSYLLAATDSRDERKGFQLARTRSLQLSAADLKLLRVETLGSRYNCYTFRVVRDDVSE